MTLLAEQRGELAPGRAESPAKRETGPWFGKPLTTLPGELAPGRVGGTREILAFEADPRSWS